MAQLIAIAIVSILICGFAFWLVSNVIAQESEAEEKACSPTGRILPSRRYTVVSTSLSEGRYSACVKGLPGFTAYGETAQSARTRASALALHQLAARIAEGEMSLQGVQFVMRADADPETDGDAPGPEHPGEPDSAQLRERSSHTHEDRFQRRAEDAIDAAVHCGDGVPAHQVIERLKARLAAIAGQGAEHMRTDGELRLGQIIRHSVLLYFAPLVGACRGIRTELRLVQRQIDRERRECRRRGERAGQSSGKTPKP